MMHEIFQDFFENTAGLKQDQIDFLVVRHGVPVMALCWDGDGRGCIVGTARVTLDGRLFEFAEPDAEKSAAALIFVARDRLGEPRDLVAWQPREDWVAAHYGRVTILGEHDLLAPRLSPAVAVHKGVLAWLQAGRTGVVIVDKRHAWRALDGVTVAASNLDHGLQLRQDLTPPAPRIVVPAKGRSAA